MPRQSDPIDDRTPLDGSRIDVAARVGWLLRTHRTVAGVSLRQMSEALGAHGLRISAATLSRVESEGQRSPAVIDGYIEVLGLREGGLRAHVDGVCRAFSYSPPSLPDTKPITLESFSRACERVQDVRPTGGAWLDFARQHALGRFGLPLGLIEPLVDRLVDEIGRCVAEARFTRHEALNQILTSDYAPLVTSRIQRAIEDPDNQSFADLASVLSDQPSPELAVWAGRLLATPSFCRVRVASFMLQGMLVRGGLALATWRDVVPLIREARDAAQAHAGRLDAIDQVVAALPNALHADLRAAGIPGSTKQKLAVDRTRVNPLYSLAGALARATCAELGHPDEPLLERLIFEACFEPRGVRMTISSWLLLGSPFAATLVRNILLWDSWPDSSSRSAAFRVAAMCHDGRPLADGEAILRLDGPDDFLHATNLIGRSGDRLPDHLLARGLGGDEMTVRQTLYCLGMAGDPRLAALAERGAQPPAITRAARWWLDRGGRVLV